MSRIDVDVPSLRSFIGKYKIYLTDIFDLHKRLVDAWLALDADWDDSVKKRFEEKFTDASRYISKFMEGSEQDLHYLHNRLEKAERYLEN